MIMSKAGKVLILSLLFAMVFSATAMAGTREGQSAPGRLPLDTADNPGAPVTGGTGGKYVDNGDNVVAYPEDRSAPDIDWYVREYGQEVYHKHREVDKYLFEDNVEKVKSFGFTVTHTGPKDGYVEIGITPYTAEYADCLYDLFGDTLVRVVEGVEAQILPFLAEYADDDVEIDIARTGAELGEGETLVSQINDDESGSLLPYIIGGFVVLCGAVILPRALRKNKIH